MSEHKDMEVDEAPEPTRRRIIPWVEKYRPSKVEEVSHQDEVLRTLKTSIEQGNLPHLLFHGPPGTCLFTLSFLLSISCQFSILPSLHHVLGTGKTTTILALARALYGPDLYKTRTLELNASDDRGISVVREKVKSFAQGAVGVQKVRYARMNLQY